jgi:serine/threonine-protein kinase RsbW
MLDKLEAYAAAAALPPQTAHRLAVICEECAANVVMHGADGEGAATYVEITIDDGAGELRLSIEDDGRPFNPLVAPKVDTGLNIDERAVGGLGIHFMRGMTRALAYDRVAGRNRVTAVMDITG